MWELLAESWVADGDDAAVVDARAPGPDDDDTMLPGDVRSLLLALADQARSQENLLEELRRGYGLELFG